VTFARKFLFAAAFFASSFSVLRSSAQTDIPAQLLDRPPIAAPTSKIEVGAISVVLSASQEVDNFASGLALGLLAGGRTTGIGFVVVKDDHVMLQQTFGSIRADTRFPVGALAGAFDALGAMRMIENGKLKETDDIAKALGESGNRGLTVAQVLTRQAGDPRLLARAVEKASGQTFYDYAAKEIAAPLGMMATRAHDGRLETTLTDMSHLAIALVNGGAYGTGHILEPATVDLMERNHFTVHPAFPGAAYGFQEMLRNGWRALQHDGATREYTARLVIVPEAKVAYVILAQGNPGERVWRTLDNGLFDRLFPPRKPEQAASAQAVPGAAEARSVAGTYEPVRDSRTSATLLKVGARLVVRATSDGNLILSGAENDTLRPRPGGYWDNGNGNIRAVARGGEIVLSSGIYGPLAFYKRAEFYALLALLAAAATAAYIVYEKRKLPNATFPSGAVVAGVSACIVLLLASAFVWLLSPLA
jgi:CubicO group peptidase (beta-lactamase class C family)